MSEYQGSQLWSIQGQAGNKNMWSGMRERSAQEPIEESMYCFRANLA